MLPFWDRAILAQSSYAGSAEILNFTIYIRWGLRLLWGCRHRAFNMADETKDTGPVQELIATGGSPLTIRYAPREMVMHTLSGPELDAVASTGLSNSVNMAFFGIATGSAVAFSIVLMTVPILEPKTYAAVVGLAWISGFTSLLFGIRAGIDYRKTKAKLRELKTGHAY